MSDITNQSLKEIIENIKSKKISSLDLTRSYIKNIEGAKKLNTFITVDPSACRSGPVGITNILLPAQNLLQVQSRGDSAARRCAHQGTQSEC